MQYQTKTNNNMDTFSKLLEKLNGRNEVNITFNKSNIYPFDDFLIQVFYYGKEQKITIKRGSSGILCVLFDGDEPMLLENCPESFWKSIIKNL